MSKFEMLEGRGKGGPLHGIKLTASYAWDGAIIQTQTKDYITYYQGRYKYEPWERVWEWKPQTVPRKANRRNMTREYQ